MKGNSVLKFFLVALALVFVIHQLYSSVYKPIKTESASYYEAVDGLKITGILIREEHLVTCDTPGVLHYLAGDGSRVARGGTIANVYDSEGASLTMSEIDSVTKQIEDITDLQSYNNWQASDLELVNGKVGSALDALLVDCGNGNFAEAQSGCDALLSAINRRQVITGEQTDFSAQLNQLNSRLAQLNGSLPAAKAAVTAPESGYFSAATDGYEGVLTCGDLSVVTPDFLKNLAEQPVAENVIGKIVSDYEWYIAAKVTINQSLKYKEGDSLTIRTALKSNPTLNVTVKQINIASNSDSAVVIFACNRMSSALAAMRTGPMTVVSATHSGLKVGKGALRVIDSQTGVYVLSGISLKFVPVNVVYRNNEYIICEQQQSTSEVLRLYDEVVVKGKNLYDGKVVG